ncbi:MAG TPA: hypothetical protein VE133_01250 [Candidatus Sulfotelmatobacter sp.]|nr:hypothetical protein [Candidatus Sulfotelmatobacter sp.]
MQANALIFLTGDKRICDKDRRIIRWLDADQINLLADGFISPKMYRLLPACHDALKPFGLFSRSGWIVELKSCFRLNMHVPRLRTARPVGHST